MLTYLAVVAALLMWAAVLHPVQIRLEAWDYQRHAND